MSLRYALPIAALALLVTPAAGLADVSLRNGNFYIGYVDVSYEGSLELKVERTYNSKSPFKGMFGWGWGCEFDMYLEITGDGSILLHEYGGGAENLFKPATIDSERTAAAIETLLRTAQDNRDILNAEALDAYRLRLARDASFRNEEWAIYRKAGLLSDVEIPVGTVLRSAQVNQQVITRRVDGYERRFDDGRSEDFDNQGRLRRIATGNNDFIEFDRDGNERIRMLRDNLGRRLAFTFNAGGLLLRLDGGGGRSVEYRYNADEELVYSKDADDQVYEYRYDDGKRHNLTKILYEDGTARTIDYYDREEHENVKRVTEPDGRVMQYSYTVDPLDSDHNTVKTVVLSKDGVPLSESTNEYFSRRTAGGEQQLARLITVTNGMRVETEYDDAGRPVRVRNGDEETRTVYDDRGHVRRKETTDTVVEMVYDNLVNRPSQVRTFPKGKPEQASVSEFEYDAKGNLLVARGAGNRVVKLSYDESGRIVELASNTARIQLSYNSESRPEVIRLVGIGEMSIRYGSDGEIKQVDGDRVVAAEVLRAYSALADIIRPAGVALGL